MVSNSISQACATGAAALHAAAASVSVGTGTHPVITTDRTNNPRAVPRWHCRHPGRRTPVVTSTTTPTLPTRHVADPVGAHESHSSQRPTIPVLANASSVALPGRTHAVSKHLSQLSALQVLRRPVEFTPPPKYPDRTRTPVANSRRDDGIRGAPYPIRHTQPRSHPIYRAFSRSCRLSASDRFEPDPAPCPDAPIAQPSPGGRTSVVPSNHAQALGDVDG
jgi:hypothetical protein